MHFHARTSMLCHPKQTVLSNGKASLLARGESLRAVLQWKSAVTFLKKILSAFRASPSQFAAKRANCKCKKFCFLSSQKKINFLKTDIVKSILSISICQNENRCFLRKGNCRATRWKNTKINCKTSVVTFAHSTPIYLGLMCHNWTSSLNGKHTKLVRFEQTRNNLRIRKPEQIAQQLRKKRYEHNAPIK